jgi:hypothetical protein
MGMKEDYEKREGVRALTDEEFEKVKQKAAKTRKERWEPLMGSPEEFERRLEREQLRREQYNGGPVPSERSHTQHIRSYGSDAAFYYRYSIPLEKVKSFFGFGKKGAK